MNEKELIKKAKEGHIESFENLIEAHEKRIYNISLKMLKNEQDAFDAAQDTFLKAFKYIGKFKEESSFSTWIYRIAVNVCLDIIKKKKETQNHISIEQQITLKDNEITLQFEDEKQNVLEDVIKAERKEALYRAIEKLKPDQKKMIILRDIEGFSYEEISKITGITTGTVKSKINRARNALKTLLLENKELFLTFSVILIMIMTT